MSKELDFMCALWYLRDIGVSKLHGTFKKERGSWMSEEFVQGEVFDNHININTHKDPKLRDVIGLEMTFKIMGILGQHLIEKVENGKVPIASGIKIRYTIDTSNKGWFHLSAMDVVKGESYDIIDAFNPDVITEPIWEIK